MPPYTGKNSWFYRRLLIFFVTGLASFLLVYLAMRGNDGALHQLIAEGAWWVLFGILATYVCGASIDDLVGLRMGIPFNRRTEDKDATVDRSETR